MPCGLVGTFPARYILPSASQRMARLGHDWRFGEGVSTLSGMGPGRPAIVAAGRSVTKRFPDGDEVPAGLLARPIRELSPYAGWYG